MKNKLKQNPFLYTAVILAALFTLLIVSAIGLFYYVFAIPEPEGFSLASWPATFTDNFSFWIEETDGTVGVKEIGIERLDDYGLWVQILDETGQEIFSHNKPAHYAESYGMAELVTLAQSRYENGNTVFISSVTVPGRTLNYIVGFPYAVGKYMLYYNGEHVARLSPFTKNVVICLVCMMILSALACTLWLSRKLSALIGGVQNITRNSYRPMKETGVFGEIYGSLNKMNEEMRHSEKLQQETDRTRKEWIANITHDLKTPLSPVKGYAELLADGNDLESQTVQDYGKIILRNAGHMETLLDDLKLTYQLEAGALPCTLKQIPIVRYLKELVINIANAPAFSKRSIEFQSGIPELTIAADPGLLRRAVENLIINALVHNPPDTKVGITVGKAPDNRLSISISDNGNGMNETELSGLWNRYYRGTNTKKRPEGSGLGLAIAKQIILLHGGEITVSSRPGEGSEFIILLPTGKFEK